MFHICRMAPGFYSEDFNFVDLKTPSPQQRGDFQSTLVFVLASLGSAVGVANLIAFPPLFAQHGILFLVVYLLLTLMIGVPLMSMEISIGHAAKASPVVSYETLGGRKWRFVGIINIVCCFVIFPIFVMLLVWTCRYSVGFAFNTAPSDFGAYGKDHVGEAILIAACLIALNVFIVSRGVSEGIGRLSKFVVPVFGMMLLFFALRNLSNWEAISESFGNAFRKYPQDINAWASMLSSALGQAFFSLSLGAGSMLMYGSYLKSDATMKRPQKIVTLANIIVQSDTVVGLVCCLFVLPLGFSLRPGMGLIFGTLFSYFNALPRGLGSIFFLCLSFIALTMTISVFEPVVGSIVEIYKKKRWVAALFVGVISLVMVVPMALSFGSSSTFTAFLPDKSFFDLMFDIFMNIALPFSGLMTILFVNRAWTLKSFENESGLDHTPGFVRKYIRLCAMFLTPALLMILLATQLISFFNG
jgi:NSS family neurotransmitter:Na+ symporter